MKNSLISENYEEITIFKTNLRLMETLGILEGVEEKNKGILELVHKDGNYQYWIVLIDKKILKLGEVDENPFSQNLNIFSDRKTKDLLINSQN